MWENMVEPGTSQMTIQWTQKKCDLPVRYLRPENRYTLRIFDAYCSSTTKAVTRKRQIVTSYVHYLSS